MEVLKVMLFNRSDLALVLSLVMLKSNGLSLRHQEAIPKSIE